MGFGFRRCFPPWTCRMGLKCRPRWAGLSPHLRPRLGARARWRIGRGGLRVIAHGSTQLRMHACQSRWLTGRHLPRSYNGLAKQKLPRCICLFRRTPTSSFCLGLWSNGLPEHLRTSNFPQTTEVTEEISITRLRLTTNAARGLVRWTLLDNRHSGNVHTLFHIWAVIYLEDFLKKPTTPLIQFWYSRLSLSVAIA